VSGFWWRRDEPAWAEVVLWPLSLASLAYRGGAALSRGSIRPVRAGAPVISVGNLVVGGAGKTPVALELAERLLRRGKQPALLSRGYGRRARHPLEVLERTPCDLAGDEPLLLKRRCPRLRVLVGPRRALLASQAVARGADVLLLDDGLQHHELERDLDVVVMDASNPVGNGRLLPRGPLREPLDSLGRVRRGLLWLTRCDLPRAAELPRLPLSGPVESAFVARDAQPLDGKAAFLFAGLARPPSFDALVRSRGAKVLGSRWFGDHHAYSSRDLQQLRRAAELAGAEVLVTTEKDAVRLRPSDLTGPPPVVSVPVDLRILAGEGALEAALDEVLR
jgi:tetraacyldisaccharide 4'-kinase